MIFQGITPTNTTGMTYTLTSDNGIQFSLTNSSTNYGLWSFFFDPTKLSTNSLWTILGLSVVGVAAGIAISLVTKSDLVILFSVLVIVFASGTLALIPLYHIIYADTYGFAAAAGTDNCEVTYVNYIQNYNYQCQPPIFISAILVGTLALYWFWVCLEWWSARSAT
jgi:phage shock protein PspC (stress-responsive transcriptional regulator)